MKLLAVLSLSLFFSVLSTVQAKQFEIFDGQYYNGKYYPLVDIIEWSEGDAAPHIEFHLHSKEKPVDVAAVSGEKNGKPVLWIMYDLAYRGERVCRHVLAPSHFRKGMPLQAYIDKTDPDYDTIYFSSEPKVGKNLRPYRAPEYQRCIDENASNMPDENDASLNMPAQVNAQVDHDSIQRGPASLPKEKNIGPDYENNAVPFSF